MTGVEAVSNGESIYLLLAGLSTPLIGRRVDLGRKEQW
jgi:hypothetical protein